MIYSIGKQLGEMAAHLERRLSEDPDDIEAMQKLAFVSESYRNFSMGGLKGFQDDFDRGYAAIVAEVQEFERSEQARYERERSDPSGLDSGP